jgi:hypothetical protein
VAQASEIASLAEYTALRAEIAQRSATQQALIALDLTAIASIVGFALTGRSSDSLLLIMPVVSSVLWLLWLDHHRNICLIGAYIRTELWRDQLPSWETWFAARRSPLKELLFWGTIVIFYSATSIAPLVVGWPAKDATAALWVLTVFGVGLTLVFAFALVSVWLSD